MKTFTDKIIYGVNNDGVNYDEIINLEGFRGSSISDRDIKKLRNAGILTIKTSNPDLITNEQIENHINCSTVDITIAPEISIYKVPEKGYIDMKDKDSLELEEMVMDKEEGFLLQPGEHYLARTQEIIGLPDFIEGTVIGRSSIARCGIQIEAAGYLDPAWEGTITLEVVNFNKFPVKIYPGQRFGQCHFQYLSSVPETPYNKKKDSKYMNQIKPTASKVFNDNL